jgi:hypothetical protein
MGLRWQLKYRTAKECDCEGGCYQCNEFGHSDCWQRVALWRRLLILWKERGDVR